MADDQWSALYEDERWIRRRQQELFRAGHECEWCHSQEPPLQVHHWAYEGAPWEAPDGTLTVLCRPHHEIADQICASARRVLGRLFAAGSDMFRAAPELVRNGLEQIEEKGDAPAFLSLLAHVAGGWDIVQDGADDHLREQWVHALEAIRRGSE